AEASHALSAAGALQARRALELARHALLMQTSCGWFFDDLSGLEPVLVLRHAARAIELGAALGAHLEDGFLARLEPARANRDGETGVALYRGAARSLHEALRRPGGVLPAAWLASALEHVLDDRLRDLPRGAADALALLELAEAAGVRLDLGPAQVRVLAWWKASPPERTGATVAALCTRLAVAPEEA